MQLTIYQNQQLNKILLDIENYDEFKKQQNKQHKKKHR